MKNLGAALIILGLLLIIFKASGCQNERPSAITDWMTQWGSQTEWAIKAGIVGVGIVLVALADRKRK